MKFFLSLAMLFAMPGIIPAGQGPAAPAPHYFFALQDTQKAGNSDVSHPAWPPPPARERVRHVETISSLAAFEKDDEGFFSKLLGMVFGGEKEDRALVQPVGIAVSPSGRIYVADPGAKGVHIVDREEKKYSFVAGADDIPFASPVGVACAPDGTVYVSDSETGRVVIADGELGARRVIRDHLSRPTGIAFAGGKLYVADAGKHAIVVFAPDGTFEGEFGKRGAGEGEFNFPVALAVRDTLFVVDALNYRIAELDRGGRFLAAFGVQGNAAGRFASPKSASLDSRGNLYVTDALMDIVQIFDPAGRLLLVFGRHGNGDGEFMNPAGTATDSSDRLYVVDTLNRRIQIFQCLP